MNNPQNQWVKRIIIFFTSQTITLFGSSLVQFAISWHITLTTKSGLMMTIATICGFLPQVLISLFSGVWADRYNRKFLIVISDGMIALCTAILAILFLFGNDSIYLLFFISVIRSIGAGIQSPAVGAFLPEIVPQDKLMKANGINASIMSLSMLFAPVAAGGLYNYMGIGTIFWIDVITAFIGIALLLTLKTNKREVSNVGEIKIIEDIMIGIKYVASTKWLKQFLGFYLFYSLMFGPVVFLTPLMVARSFGEEPWRLVVHEIVFAAGSIVGGIIVGIWGGLKNKVHTLIFASVAFGLTTFIMGFSPNFWFYLGVMLPMGITVPFINTSSMTVLQTKVNPDLIGRVFGLVTIIASSAMPMSMLFFGPLADIISVELQLIITGLVMILISLAMLGFKEVIEIGKPQKDMENGLGQ